MSMYDRDWYREERRQQRQAERERQARPVIQSRSLKKRSYEPSWWLVLAVAVVAGLILGFA